MQFHRRHSRNRIRAHHRIQPLYQQRSAANAAGFHESTTVHDFFRVTLASLGLEAQRHVQITIVGLPFTTAVVTRRYGDNLVVSGYTFASSKNTEGVMTNRIMFAFVITALLAIVCGSPSTILAQTTARYDLLLNGGHVIDPANHIDEVRDVAVLQGKIARVEK